MIPYLNEIHSRMREMINETKLIFDDDFSIHIVNSLEVLYFFITFFY